MTISETVSINDIQAERATFNEAISTLRETAEKAMRGLGCGNFGG
jgi:hypothetical protein